MTTHSLPTFLRRPHLTLHTLIWHYEFYSMEEVIRGQVILFREPQINAVFFFKVAIYVAAFCVHGGAEGGEELAFFEIEVFEAGG